MCSNVEHFNRKSINAHSSNDAAFSSAKQAAVHALNQPLSDRLAMLPDNSNGEENVVTTPASKRARYDPPSCVISDDDEDIGHVKVVVITPIDDKFVDTHKTLLFSHPPILKIAT